MSTSANLFARTTERARVRADAEANGYFATLEHTENARPRRAWRAEVKHAGVTIGVAFAGTLPDARRLAQETVDRDVGAS